MSLLNMKFNEDTMYEQLRGGLLPNEQITAAVYASFQNAGFFGGGGMQAGFLALTDQDRLIGVRHGLAGSAPFAGYLGLLRKLKVKKGLFGSRVIEYDDGSTHLRITVTPKLGSGIDLPHQAEHFQTLIAALETRQI